MVPLSHFPHLTSPLLAGSGHHCHRQRLDSHGSRPSPVSNLGCQPKLKWAGQLWPEVNSTPSNFPNDFVQILSSSEYSNIRRKFIQTYNLVKLPLKFEFKYNL
jgi:hypothetical protein